MLALTLTMGSLERVRLGPDAWVSGSAGCQGDRRAVDPRPAFRRMTRAARN
jgi:hypothetical protein